MQPGLLWSLVFNFWRVTFEKGIFYYVKQKCSCTIPFYIANDGLIIN